MPIIIFRHFNDLGLFLLGKCFEFQKKRSGIDTVECFKSLDKSSKHLASNPIKAYHSP